MASVTASYVRQLFLAMDANLDSEVTAHELLEFLRKHKPKHGPYSSLAKVHSALGLDVLGHRVDWTAFQQAFHKSGMVPEEFEFNFTELPKGAKHIGGRPVGAVGTFLRIVTVNDVYTLKNYPMMATAVELARSQMAELDCVVSSHNNGDWMSPCMLSSIDGGAGMVEGLNYGKIDRVCLGNHEFDKGFDALKSKTRTYKGVLLNSNITGPPSFLAELPKYDTMEVGEKTVLFTGFCVDDRALYKPSATPTVVKVHDAIPQVWSEAKKALGRTPDAHIPMTHQVIADDRTTASMLAAHPELGSRTPCILGGHDHDEFVEVADGVHIVKVGQNAEKIGFVDVWWATDGSLHCQSKSVPATEFKKEAEAESFYQRKQNLISTMMEMPITVCPAGTTKRVRFEESTTVKWLLGMIKRAKKDEGVEMCINIGGNIRANAGACQSISILTSPPFSFKMAQNLDLRCVLVPAPWVLGPKHVSNPE